MLNIAVVNGTLILIGLLALLVGTALHFGIGIGLMAFGAAACAVYFWNTRGVRAHGPG